ncbi:transglutaminase family protein [Aurantimonas endophytica]|uniref:Transglutaminase-like putative cysteine protease n=1 Tax=Aurantimonas endophytica TaxID=1522175 RepID=A0A7W6HDZ6_9HYPH|nr:transglutaminase family protein [Aurantimonas endophytica]MBB4003286.1 transglutaminase-like putative cysteine protease [Aurantimonas endophytica]MCO6404147.1 transglutaminase family protein [Aurantimonas endophytica]
MIYDLTLKIGYDYRSAVTDARHSLRVRPRSDRQQAVTDLTLTLAPLPDECIEERDFFGNAVDAVVFHRPHRNLSVEMRARVQVDRPVVELERAPGLAELAETAFLHRDSGGEAPMHFLGTSRIVAPLPAVTDYAEPTLVAPGSTGPAILALTRQIKADFAYLPGSTDVRTSVAAAFAQRSGVCQDFAHIMIAALRAWRIPAAYVSGFLRTDPPPGRPRLEGADAMHAWVEAWLGDDLGWVGFDPTNGIVAGDDHVVVAVGRDYADVAPVAGTFVTTGRQRTRHSVDMVPVLEA